MRTVTVSGDGEGGAGGQVWLRIVTVSGGGEGRAGGQVGLRTVTVTGGGEGRAGGQVWLRIVTVSGGGEGRVGLQVGLRTVTVTGEGEGRVGGQVGLRTVTVSGDGGWGRVGGQVGLRIVTVTGGNIQWPLCNNTSFTTTHQPTLNVSLTTQTVQALADPVSFAYYTSHRAGGDLFSPEVKALSSSGYNSQGYPRLHSRWVLKRQARTTQRE